MRKRFDRGGDLRELDLLAALVALWREKASVTLDFTRTGVTGGFDIADGEVVATFSADPRFENAAILVRAGKLDPAALERLAVPEGSDRAMAAMQAGVLTRREWKWSEKIRAIEVLSDLLTWSDGRYLAEPDTRSVSGEFRLPIPRLLLELFLRSRDRALVDHQLGNPDAPLTRSEDFDGEFSTFGLTADAESVVRLIDGTATARQIAARAPAEAFAVEKLLAALVTLEMLRPAAERAGLDLPVPAPEPAEKPAPQQAEARPEENALDREIERPAAEAFADAPDLPDPSAPVEFEEESEARPSPLEAADTFETRTLDSEPVETELPGPTDAILQRSDEPSIERPAGSQGPLLLGVLAALAVAVAAVLFFRSRPSGPVASVALTASPEAPKPTDAAPPTAVPPPTAARALAGASARPTAGPTRAPAGPDRKPWLDRAQSQRRRLASEQATRYAVQLLLACEVSTLEDAWKHDVPAGSLWLQTADHQGRTCFRVLWGRFATADEARKAKDRIPRHFVTSSNRPAVVAVR